MPAPQPSDVRDLLDGFGLDQVLSLSLTGTWASGNPVVTGVNTLTVKPGDLVSGAGIPSGARVLTVDSVGASGQLTLDSNPTQDGAGAALTVTYYPVLRDGWVIKRRDSFVTPWLEETLRTSLSGVKSATEYYDGTGHSLLVLRRRPIVELVAISYTNVDSNLYYLTPSAIQVIADEGVLKAKANFNESTYIPIFYRGEKNVRVQYRYGNADWPADLKEAGAMLLAEQALTFIGNRTGGGDLSAQGYSRSFGKSGKWTHVRRQLARDAYSILRKYMTGGGQ